MRNALARIVFALILLFNAAWISAFWILNREVAAPRTQADLMLHVTRIEALLNARDLTTLTTPTNLNTLELEFQATTSDLQQLDNLLPLGGAWPFGTTVTEHHLLNLAMDTTQTAQNLISAVPILQPQLTGIVQNIMHANEGSGAVAYGGSPLTIPTINRGQHFLNTALLFWRQAQQERERITPASVAALDDAEASRFLAQFDALAPRLSTGVELASSLLDWSATALGIRVPDHFLLLVVDPSDLRPGGGRVWDYADLVTQGGTLVSGIQLHSAQSLGCLQSACGARPIPQAYAWFPLNVDQFGLADADLDPDLLSASKTITTTYRLATGVKVDGIIAITPAVYASLLSITGPLPLPGKSVVASATNIEALLTAEHEATLATGTAPGATTQDLESLLTQAILAKLAQADTRVQGDIGAALYAATQTKDLSFFGNSQRVEAMLTQLGMARSITTSNGDSLAVVDTNDGAAAVNPLVREQLSDQITLDAAGGAQHQLAITYSYNSTAAWSGGYPLQPYSDFVRVIVPAKANSPQITGPCTPTQVDEVAHVVIACQLTLAPGASVTIHVMWSVPMATLHSTSRYSVLVQRQAGAKTAVSVRIAAPAGYTLSRPTTSSGAPPRVEDGVVTWSASPLTQNTLLSASPLGPGAGAGG